MDFFEQQHRARRKTGLMLLLFAIAVAAIVAVLNLVGVAIYLWLSPKTLYSANVFAEVPRYVYGWSTAVILAVIAGGTAYRLYQLSGGGLAVASMVGARYMKRDTAEPSERKLLNVVEEMALASGVAVPLVFVMDDQHTINAFAAGFSPNRAAVIVTRGALEYLTRDELQGVVAHEFSHILNGDMRLNITLLGVIAGIVLFGSMGAAMMTGGRRADSDQRSGAYDARLFFLGLLLWILGSIGVLAGRAIKSVISREREFLADASAVQFTRNPDGMGGALFKIDRRGSVIIGRSAEELSHMCIGSPTSSYLEFDWLSTHPPVEERIERILGPAGLRLLRERSERAEAAAFADKGSAAAPEFASPLHTQPLAAPAIVASVGNPTAAHLDYAQRTLEAIPEIRAAVGSKAGAQGALFALLLGKDELREAQLGAIRNGSGADIAAQTVRIADALVPFGERMRMPLFALAIPTLKQLPGPEQQKFLDQVKALIDADGRVTLREFVLLTLCRTYLQRRGPARVKYRSVDAVLGEAVIVLSLLAHAGKGGMDAFDKGMTALGVTGGVLRAPSELDVPKVESALNELNLLAPLKKPAFIKACVAVVMADDRLTLAEGELLRAVCAALDSPLPPILEIAEAPA